MFLRLQNGLYRFPCVESHTPNGSQRVSSSSTFLCHFSREFFALTLGKPNGRISAKSGIVAVSISAALMLATTFYAYAYQVRLL